MMSWKPRGKHIWKAAGKRSQLCAEVSCRSYIEKSLDIWSGILAGGRDVVGTIGTLLCEESVANRLITIGGQRCGL